ncbi:hypothetical protein FJY94_00165 [Candidatus Kaiserbacteria bacterium]|nr:hypothetical protein [Candidatus Kaiserbacteria bacterium]
MALLKMLALISVLTGAGLLSVNQWPEKSRKLFAMLRDRLKDATGMSLDWLPGLSPEVYVGPSSWLFPVGLWATIVGFLVLVNPVFGALALAAIIGAYYLSDDLSNVLPTEFRRYNIFADKAWMERIRIPAWMRIIAFMAVAMVIALEMGAVAFLVTGLVLGLLTTAPDWFDWMGSWNAFRDRRLRLASLIMAAVGFLMAVREWHLDLLVVLGLAVYAWHYFKSTTQSLKAKFDSAQ